MTNEQKEQEHGFLKTMLDASIQAILLLEPVYQNGGIENFSIKASNPALLAHVGLNPDEVLGLSLETVFPRYKEFGFFDLYHTAYLSKEHKRQQMYYKDERIEGWFDIGVAPHQQELVVNFVNITDHHNFQKELEQSTIHLNAIINTAQSGIFLFAPVRNERSDIVDFTFTNANPAFAAYVGQKPGTIIGQRGSQWFPSYVKNGLFERYKRTYETGNSDRFDFHYYDDGLDVWLDIMSSRLNHEVLVTFTDYTPVKKLQLQLEDTIKELKRSNANLQDFAYIASHDLQEPLRKIKFFADRLKTKYSEVLDGEGDLILNRIEAATGRMASLINDLLEYSQLSSSQSLIDSVSLANVVKEVLIDLETSIQQKQATIHLAELPVIKADGVMLRQMFQNLLSNSLKYSDPMVPPVINIFCNQMTGADSGIHVSPHDEQRMFYCVFIRDNGIGFEQVHAERIFQIFQRLHGRSEYPGTGVGLAIVQKVVERHNGYIAATSTPGKGATFKILFPLD